MAVEREELPGGELGDALRVRVDADGASTECVGMAVKEDGWDSELVLAEVIRRGAAVDDQADRVPEFTHFPEVVAEFRETVVRSVAWGRHAELDDADIPAERLRGAENAVKLRLVRRPVGAWEEEYGLHEECIAYFIAPAMNYCESVV